MLRNPKSIVTNVSHSVIPAARAYYRTMLIAIDANIDSRAARMAQRDPEIGANLVTRIQRSGAAITAEAVIIKNAHSVGAVWLLIQWLIA